MHGLQDFVPGGYPLPWTPVISMGEFVAGGFPLPQNPVGYRLMPSATGSLPKAPDIPRAMIGNGGGVGCGGDCGCASCSGMGGLGDTIIPQASLPAFLQGSTFGFPTVYLAGGLLAAFLVLPMLMGGGRRRR